MAIPSAITLADNFKVPCARALYSGPLATNTASPAQTAFASLSMALAEAITAEEFLADPMSWDTAHLRLVADAEDAVNAAIHASVKAGNAPTPIASPAA